MFIIKLLEKELNKKHNKYKTQYISMSVEELEKELAILKGQEDIAKSFRATMTFMCTIIVSILVFNLSVVVARPESLPILQEKLTILGLSFIFFIVIVLIMMLFCENEHFGMRRLIIEQLLRERYINPKGTICIQKLLEDTYVNEIDDGVMPATEGQE